MLVRKAVVGVEGRVQFVALLLVRIVPLSPQRRNWVPSKNTPSRSLVVGAGQRLQR